MDEVRVEKNFESFPITTFNRLCGLIDIIKNPLKAVQPFWQLLFNSDDFIFSLVLRESLQLQLRHYFYRKPFNTVKPSLLREDNKMKKLFN